MSSSTGGAASSTGSGASAAHSFVGDSGLNTPPVCGVLKTPPLFGLTVSSGVRGADGVWKIPPPGMAGSKPPPPSSLPTGVQSYQLPSLKSILHVWHTSTSSKPPSGVCLCSFQQQLVDSCSTVFTQCEPAIPNLGEGGAANT